MANAFFELAAGLLLMGILALAAVLIILAMCAVASDADEKTEEWLKNNEEGRLNDESKGFFEATEKTGQDH